MSFNFTNKFGNPRIPQLDRLIKTTRAEQRRGRMYATREHVVLVAHELPMLFTCSNIPQSHRLVVGASDRKVLVLACAEHFSRIASEFTHGIVRWTRNRWRDSTRRDAASALNWMSLIPSSCSSNKSTTSHLPFLRWQNLPMASALPKARCRPDGVKRTEEIGLTAPQLIVSDKTYFPFSSKFLGRL